MTVLELPEGASLDDGALVLQEGRIRFTAVGHGITIATLGSYDPVLDEEELYALADWLDDVIVALTVGS